MRFLILASSIILLASCAAGGNSPFTHDAPAGFFYGLWHGIISFIALIIHIFNDGISVYEVHNTGGWYDFGFLIGITAVYGGGSTMCCKPKRKTENEKEWDEIGDKVEKKVMRKMKDWAESDNDIDDDTEWKDINKKVEKKLKRKIREWAEKD